MDTTRTARWIAALLLLQGAGGALVNFGLLAPITGAPGGFLVNAAAHPEAIGAAVLVGLATGAMTLALAILLGSVLRPAGDAAASWLLALAATCFALTAAEHTAVLSMLSLSQAYTKAGAPAGDLYDALRGVVGAARTWTHYVQLLVVGGMYLVFYGALLRHALVPRALAAFGLVAVVFEMIAAALPVFGQPIVFALLAPIGLAQLALAGWLAVRGFTVAKPAAAPA